MKRWITWKIDLSFTFGILIFLSIPVFIAGCGPSAEQVARTKQERQDSTIKANNDIIKATRDTIKVLNEVSVVQKVRHWSSYETKLPSGVVQASDCAMRNTASQDSKNNYITIRKSDGISTIVKDVDEDLFFNIAVGDIIE